MSRTKYKLGAIAPLKYGKSLPERKRVPGSFPVVSSAGITGNHDKPLVEGPSIVIGRKGSIGAVHYIGQSCFPIDTTFYTQGTDKVSLEYLYYLLQELPLTLMNNDSAVPGLNRAQAEDLDVDVPPLPEQKAIAATLGVLDDKIESNQRIVASAALLLEEYSSCWGEQLPLVELSALADLRRKTVSPTKLDQALVDHYSLPMFDARQLPERVEPTGIKSSKTLIPGNAVLVSRLNPRIDRSWWVEIDTTVPSLASTEFACLTAENESDLAKVWLAIRHPLFQDALNHRTTGTSGSHQRVRPDDVMTIEVPDFGRLAPERSEAVLALLRHITWARKANRKLASLRDSLLPELMAGRIRVPEAREAMEHRRSADATV